MTTQSFEHLFGYKKTDSDIFYIDWRQPNPVAQWLINKPNNPDFEATINWKQVGQIITICCHDIQESNQSPQITDKKTTNSSQIPLFKSMLQKCVRRGFSDRTSGNQASRQMSETAIWIGYHLLEIDVGAFLRRLIVIMLEDVCLHISAINIIWLTSAVTKGYILHTSQVSWLLGIIQMLCDEPYKELKEISFSSLPIPNCRQLWKKIQTMTKNSSIPPVNQNILSSLIFRLSYGGMKSDLAMFGWYINRYFNINQYPSQRPIIPKLESQIVEISVNELPLCGVDFYCFPQILTILQNKFPQLTIDPKKLFI